jgi:hypothetical protein
MVTGMIALRAQFVIEGAQAAIRVVYLSTPSAFQEHREHRFEIEALGHPAVDQRCAIVDGTVITQAAPVNVDEPVLGDLYADHR